MKLWVIRHIPVEKTYRVKNIDRDFHHTEFSGYEKVCELHLASLQTLQDPYNKIYLEDDSGGLHRLEYDPVVTERLKNDTGKPLVEPTFRQWTVKRWNFVSAKARCQDSFVQPIITVLIIRKCKSCQDLREIDSWIDLKQ